VAVPARRKPATSDPPSPWCSAAPAWPALTAGQLQATGGDGFDKPNSDIPIDHTGEIVARTGHLPAGDVLEELCQAGSGNGPFAFDAGVIAIRIRSSHGTPPA
jgi:hypothetical protein